MRHGTLMALDRSTLENRLSRYLDPKLTFQTVQLEKLGPVAAAGRFNPETARQNIVPREPYDPAKIVRYSLLPLDNRYAYHTTIRPIWNEPRPEFAGQMRDGNLFIVSRMMAERPLEGLPIIPAHVLVDYHLLRPNVQAIPTRIYQSNTPQGDMLNQGTGGRSNLSVRARDWLTSIGWPDPDSTAEAGKAAWLHALAIGCSSAWLKEHGPAIRSSWPRIPLPTDAAILQASAALGARIVDLLDPDKQVPGVTAGNLNAPFAIIGAITRSGGGALSAAELDITVGWGHGGAGRPVMPGQGRVTERTEYSAQELAEIERAAVKLGETTKELVDRLGQPVDVWLNGVAYWRTVPKNVWEFIIGGYLVFKKWLSYRDHEILGRPITTAEAREASAIIRRLTALIIMQPELDENYRGTCASAFAWPRGTDP